MAFHGSQRKLVLAFDIGTTYSGISYSILDPGQVPEIKGVTRFPSQEYIGGSSKIPTIIYYDRKGKVRAVGAEAVNDAIFERAEDEKWIKTEWFKLHLRPKLGDETDITNHLMPLPLNKTVVEIFADFLKYLLACAKSYIKTNHANGPDLWRSVKKNIDFVLSHPNGWEGTEQTKLRQAAVLAGLVPDNTKGHAQLSFVTEGEASLHFAIRKGLPDGAMKQEQGVVIVDAGGGTIDISSYVKNGQVAEEIFQEIAVPQCRFHGSVFVSIHARHFLEKHLSDSMYIDDLEHIVHCFDTTTKLRFRDADEPQYIRFGCTKDNDPNCNIRLGQLKVSGSDIASCFQPSIDCIVDAVLKQKKTAEKQISHVVLVGGFAANEWLYSHVKAGLVKHGLTIFKPDSQVSKAVPDGAISFYLDHFVGSRIAKFSYGPEMSDVFCPNDPEHRQREVKTLIDLDGEKKVPGRFHVILFKNAEVKETEELRQSCWMLFSSESQLKCPTVGTIYCYRGTVEHPKWMDIDSKNYQTMGIIQADLSSFQPIYQVNQETKQIYFSVAYELVFLFGLTELKVQIAWKEDGVEKRSPAKVIYLPFE